MSASGWGAVDVIVREKAPAMQRKDAGKDADAANSEAPASNSGRYKSKTIRSPSDQDRYD